MVLSPWNDSTELTLLSRTRLSQSTVTRETSKSGEFTYQPGVYRDQTGRGIAHAEISYPEVKSSQERERAHAKEIDLV